MADLTPAEPAAEPLPTCPFCDGAPIEERVLRGGHVDGGDDAWAYFVCCRSCAAEGPWTKSAGSARRMWSMRHSAALDGSLNPARLFTLLDARTVQPCRRAPKYVVCVGVHGDLVLAHQKRHGPLGSRGWNGPGGEIRPGESTLQAAAREWAEEVVGLSPVPPDRWWEVARCAFGADQVGVAFVACDPGFCEDGITVDGEPARWLHILSEEWTDGGVWFREAFLLALAATPAESLAHVRAEAIRSVAQEIREQDDYTVGETLSRAEASRVAGWLGACAAAIERGEP